jgi:NarL family two-component system response regulator LiaR
LSAGIRHWLEAEARYAVVGEVSTSGDAMTFVSANPLDIVIMTTSLKDQDSTAVCAAITTAWPQVGVLLLGDNDWEESLVGAWRAGAGGFLPRDAEMTAVLAAVHQIVSGGRIFSPEQQRRIGFWERGVGILLRTLTRREEDVLKLVAKGLSNRDIAQTLVISERTVNKHVGALLAKLKVASRAQIASFAFQHHLVGGETTLLKMGDHTDYRTKSRD